MTQTNADAMLCMNFSQLSPLQKIALEFAGPNPASSPINPCRYVLLQSDPTTAASINGNWGESNSNDIDGPVLRKCKLFRVLWCYVSLKNCPEIKHSCIGTGHLSPCPGMLSPGLCLTTKHLKPVTPWMHCKLLREGASAKVSTSTLQSAILS